MKQLLLPGELVKKSNAIARARWGPDSVWEPRIVALVASKVREDDEDFYTYRIPVAELTGVDDKHMSGDQYQEIVKSIDRLGETKIRIQGNKPKNFRSYTIFSMCGYEDGCLVAHFDPDLKPHFLNLKKQFMIYDLNEYLMLPTTNSQQLFEFLKSWADKPEVTVAVAELHEMLNSPESYRKDFWQFRTYVLEKAQKHIHKYTKLEYEWEPIKQGVSVVSVRFVFSKKRIIERQKEQKQTDTKKQVDANNKLFRDIVECRKQNGLKSSERCINPSCSKRKQTLCCAMFE